MGYLNDPHYCRLPNLIFEYPDQATRQPVGRRWQCDDCQQVWEVQHGFTWNKWKEAPQLPEAELRNDAGDVIARIPKVVTPGLSRIPMPPPPWWRRIRRRAH